MVGLLALFGRFCTTCVCQLNTNTCVWLQSFAFCWVVGVQHTVNEAWLFQRNRKCITNGTSVKTVFIWRGDYCLIHISVAIQKGVWWCNALNIFRRGICQNCNLHNIPWIMSSLQALWSLRLNTVFWKTYQRKVSHSMDSSFSQVSGSVSNASIRPIRMQCATHPKEGKTVTVLVFTVWFFSAIQRILHFLTRTQLSLKKGRKCSVAKVKLLNFWSCKGPLWWILHHALWSHSNPSRCCGLQVSVPASEITSNSQIVP